MTAAPAHSASETKKATVNGLAVVGFGALIIGGILLAIYASKYVPDALARLSSAVYLSTDGTKNPDETGTRNEEPDQPLFPVVIFPDDTSDDTTDDADTTPDTSTDNANTPETGGPLVVPKPPTAVSPNPPVYYPPQYYQPQPVLYGLPDLAIINAKVGYFRGSTFVEDNEAPGNRDIGVKFTVKNLGTNIVSGWTLRIDVEGEDTLTGNGSYLTPGGTQNFTVRATNPEEGENIRIEIDIDHQDRIDESNERNNDANLDIDIDD